MIDASGLVVGDDLVDLSAAGLDAGQVGGGLQIGFSQDAGNGAVGPLSRRASGPIGDRDKGRVEWGQALDRLP